VKRLWKFLAKKIRAYTSVLYGADFTCGSKPISVLNMVQINTTCARDRRGAFWSVRDAQGIQNSWHYYFRNRCFFEQTDLAENSAEDARTLQTPHRKPPFQFEWSFMGVFLPGRLPSNSRRYKCMVVVAYGESHASFLSRFRQQERRMDFCSGTCRLKGVTLLW
jgi:hypothetical protein